MLSGLLQTEILAVLSHFATTSLISESLLLGTLQLHFLMIAVLFSIETPAGSTGFHKAILIEIAHQRINAYKIANTIMA